MSTEEMLREMAKVAIELGEERRKTNESERIRGFKLRYIRN